jgi:glycosyltransferase involved in cell wall biosynthesis
MTQALLRTPRPGAETGATLRVLVASNLYPPYRVGGAEVVASDLATSMAGAGHQVFAVSTEHPDRLEGSDLVREERDGVRVMRFFPRNLYPIQDLYARPAKPRPGPHVKALWHLRDAWNTHAGAVFATVLDEVRPDVMHTHNIDGFSPIVWEMARRRGIPVVHTAHDLHLVCPKATLIRGDGSICGGAPLPCRAYRAWYGRRARSVQRFCSPSAFLLERHAGHGVWGERSEVVRNGIPMPWLDRPVLRPRRRAGDPLRVVFMGQLGRHKGLHTLLDAFRHGLPGGLDVRLEVAGAGPLEDEVHAAAHADPRITFHGFVRAEEKSALLTSADLFVLASTYYDNAPLSILEAYGYGVPVAAARIGGLPELVREGETGWLFEPGDAAALAAILEAAARDPERIEAMRPRVRAEAADFTVEAMHARYEAIYREEVALAAGARR